MTKRLEELFELNNSEEKFITDVKEEISDINTVITPETLSVVEKIENSLPSVKGLEASDGEMDELANLAKESFNNLMDLGMQVDSRFSAEIFAVAGNMLGHALTAKTAKINKKLKMIDLQLKQAELERKLSITNKDKSIEETPLGTGMVLDRNELLRMISKQVTSHENNKKDK